MLNYNRNLTPNFEYSQNEHGGVVIKIKKSVYYYDLKRITDFEFYNDNSLRFKLIGQKDREFVSGEIARCLFAALTDWHGKVKKQ